MRTHSEEDGSEVIWKESICPIRWLLHFLVVLQSSEEVEAHVSEELVWLKAIDDIDSEHSVVDHSTDGAVAHLPVVGQEHEEHECFSDIDRP